MGGNNYPKRFEILQNDGITLNIRIGELVKCLEECFVTHFINDEDRVVFNRWWRFARRAKNDAKRKFNFCGSNSPQLAAG
jgi:hypothetical protein